MLEEKSNLQVHITRDNYYHMPFTIHQSQRCMNSLSLHLISHDAWALGTPQLPIRPVELMHQSTLLDMAHVLFTSRGES